MAELLDVLSTWVRTAASMKFGRERRILKRANFKRVYSRGQKASGRHAVIFCLGRDAEGPAAEIVFAQTDGWRVGITATRKSGNAVQRNRQRRLVREFFRTHGDEILGGADYVVNTRRSVNDVQFADVERDLLRTLAKMGRLADAEDSTPPERTADSTQAE